MVLTPSIVMVKHVISLPDDCDDGIAVFGGALSEFVAGLRTTDRKQTHLATSEDSGESVPPVWRHTS